MATVRTHRRRSRKGRVHTVRSFTRRNRARKIGSYNRNHVKGKKIGRFNATHTRKPRPRKRGRATASLKPTDYFLRKSRVVKPPHRKRIRAVRRASRT